ncbi:Nitrilase/cyanide hydratase and apolipoprotein N-acyltransferase family protein [Theobroma cacao]|uniref:Nitrilase/cyanide hydratase and apolipoprotein N-acyltransferase family protein n=1 Tax=Theobroma cacao TaxID=3641 RepID=A0A061GS84_THECC|nr:Nitrilase/cyanide hydratase and apolipoprotein N-acyltransferase family protein [Theobroma cacao]
MKTAVSSLFNSKNLSHSAISRSLLQHSSKPFSQRAFFVPTIPRNTKNLYNQRYQKLQIRTKSTSIHLFDIDISGKITFMEPKTLIAGETTTIVDTGAHLLCYPGALNMTTGPCIGSCCTEQDAGAGYVAWGRSTLIGPFGEVLATFEHDENIIIAEIDYSILEQQRASLPSAKQRDKDSIYACGGGHDVLLREEIHNYPQVVMVMVQISTYTQEDVVGAGMIYFVKRRWCEGGGGDLYLYMKGGGGDLYVYGGNGRRVAICVRGDMEEEETCR